MVTQLKPFKCTDVYAPISNLTYIFYGFTIHKTEAQTGRYTEPILIMADLLTLKIVSSAVASSRHTSTIVCIVFTDGDKRTRSSAYIRLCTQGRHSIAYSYELCISGVAGISHVL